MYYVVQQSRAQSSCVVSDRHGGESGIDHDQEVYVVYVVLVLYVRMFRRLSYQHNSAGALRRPSIM